VNSVKIALPASPIRRRGFLGALLAGAAGSRLRADDRDFVLEVDLFVGVDCPIANAYAPKINRLHETFGSKGVRFRLVYPDTLLKSAELKQHRKDFALKPPGVLDPEHALVKRAGASVTPEAAVFDRDGTLRYRGKIDNRFTDRGDKRRVATEHYLEDTLRRLLAGETFAFREVTAVGCLIEPLAKEG